MPDPNIPAGAILTAEDLNDLNRPWTAYTSTLTTDGAGADPVLGSGGDFRHEGSYKLQGTQCQFVDALRFGSTSPSAGSGMYLITLPVAAFSADRALSGLFGTCELGNVSTGLRYRMELYLWTATTFAIESPGGPTAFVDHDSPFAENFAAGDFIWIAGLYRAA